MGKKIAGLAAVVAILVAVIVIWIKLHPPVNPLVDPIVKKQTSNVTDFDQFQTDLATRVLKKYGADKDFSAIVATTAYPLGTLLRSSGSLPADSDDCVPPVSPKMLPASRLFPSYTMSSNLALEANLGPETIQGLESAGVNLQQSQTVEYTIANQQSQIMDDKSVEQVTSQGDCGKYISGHPGVKLVRGNVIGRMTFTVKVNNPASVKAHLLKIGFSVTTDPGSSTVSVDDKQDQPIVELLSEFGSGSNASSSPLTPKPLEAIHAPGPTPGA